MEKRARADAKGAWDDEADRPGTRQMMQAAADPKLGIMGGMGGMGVMGMIPSRASSRLSADSGMSGLTSGTRGDRWFLTWISVSPFF